MRTTTTVTRIRAAAPQPGAVAMTLDDLEIVEGLLATAHTALSAEDADIEGVQVTLGLALERLRAGMERVRAIRPTDL
jgi:hypothetical protein